MLGRTVSTYTYSGAAMNEARLELGFLGSGSYVITLITGDTRQIKKLVKY